ncbi:MULTISPECIES: hypothetical protein [Rhodomicrobium]|uniref:hypothetical protein n=1 Tax=Rhodomicrobium TaxID=1068 RepID=UPI000F74952A|nr:MULTISPECIES: hypothetical protein [Rhodomicrobium]
MWELLVWAYKRQMVRYEVDRATIYRGNGNTLFRELLDARTGYSEPRGCIVGAGTTAHADAHVVHAHVQRLSAGQRDIIIATAEIGQPPEWDPAIPPLRVIPLRKRGSGAIVRIWSKSGNAIGCAITYDGVPPQAAREIRENARKLYDRWWRALRYLRGRMWTEERLSRWKVGRTGAVWQPWVSGS